MSNVEWNPTIQPYANEGANTTPNTYESGEKASKKNIFGGGVQFPQALISLPVFEAGAQVCKNWKDMNNGGTAAASQL